MLLGLKGRLDLGIGHLMTYWEACTDASVQAWLSAASVFRSQLHPLAAFLTAVWYPGEELHHGQLQKRVEGRLHETAGQTRWGSAPWACRECDSFGHECCRWQVAVWDLGLSHWCRRLGSAWQERLPALVLSC